LAPPNGAAPKCLRENLSPCLLLNELAAPGLTNGDPLFDGGVAQVRDCQG
jgi:hypothetical protein